MLESLQRASQPQGSPSQLASPGFPSSLPPAKTLTTSVKSGEPQSRLLLGMQRGYDSPHRGTTGQVRPFCVQSPPREKTNPFPQRRRCPVRRAEPGRRGRLLDNGKKKNTALGEISLLPAETGVPADLRRKLSRVHFSLPHF